MFNRRNKPIRIIGHSDNQLPDNWSCTVRDNAYMALIPLTNNKVKQSHYRPGQALRVPGGWGSQISRQSALESGKVVSPTHRPSLPPRKHSWYSFLLEAILRPEGLCQWKNPVTPLGIETATFRFVVQCLNQLRYRVAPTKLSMNGKYTCRTAIRECK